MLVPNMAEMCAQLCFAVAVGRIRMKGGGLCSLNMALLYTLATGLWLLLFAYELVL